MPDPPLRICFVVSYFHPFASGAERQALAQGAELARRGHLVHVLTHHVAWAGLPKDDEVQGVRVHRWVESSKIGPLFGMSFVASVIRGLRRLRPHFDVVHTHQALWEAVATGLSRSWLKDVPTLVQPASSGYYGEAEELARTRGRSWLRRWILRNTAFAAISADIERQWLALGVPSNRIFRTASGVDAERFRPGPGQNNQGLPPCPRVLFTGRLHPQKNLDVLLKAWPEILKRRPARLVLLGQGPERDRLAELSRQLGIADHVEFAGAVDDPAEVLRSADVFVLPSVAEGMSNSLLEAMATGLPCLASAIGGNTDLLEPGPSGLLVPPEDASAWTTAILNVLDDPEWARSLGAEARQRIVSEFALPVVVDRYEAIYRRLLNSQGGPTHEERELHAHQRSVPES